MATQRSEDAGRNMRSLWLGPTGAWRWPLDASYTEWALGILIFMITGTALWWIVPLAMPVGLIGYAFVRWQTRRLRPLVASSWLPWGLGGVSIAFVLLIFPAPRTWLLPMPFLLSVPSALLIAFLLVRAARPWIDGNRPVGYWIATIREITHAPRPRRPPVAVEWAGEPKYNHLPTEDSIAEFLLEIASTDPEEVPIVRARSKKIVEAALFDPRTGDPRQCQQVIAWLDSLEGVWTDVTSIERRTSLNGTSYPYRVGLVVNARAVEAGQVIVVHPVDSRVRRGEPAPRQVDLLSPRQFAFEYEEIADVLA